MTLNALLTQAALGVLVRLYRLTTEVKAVLALLWVAGVAPSATVRIGLAVLVIAVLFVVEVGQRLDFLARHAQARGTT